MITHFQMYLITLCTPIVHMFAMFSTFSFIAAIVFAATWGFGCDCYSETYVVAGKKWFKRTLTMGITFFALAVVIPSTKQLAAIICIPKIVNNEKVQSVSSNLLDLTDEWLKRQKLDIGNVAKEAAVCEKDEDAKGNSDDNR